MKFLGFSQGKDKSKWVRIPAEWCFTSHRRRHAVPLSQILLLRVTALLYVKLYINIHVPELYSMYHPVPRHKSPLLTKHLCLSTEVLWNIKYCGKQVKFSWTGHIDKYCPYKDIHPDTWDGIHKKEIQLLPTVRHITIISAAAMCSVQTSKRSSSYFFQS